MRKNHYLLSFVGQEHKEKTWYRDVIFVCKLGKGKGKEPRINFPKKTWETCLEVCLAARHGRSQLINLTFRSWAYFSLYYLTKNMNDFAWHGGVLVQLPLLCATRVPAAQSPWRTTFHTKLFPSFKTLSVSQTIVRYLSKAQCLGFWRISGAL